jgi:hypothetical protein
MLATKIANCKSPNNKRKPNPYTITKHCFKWSGTQMRKIIFVALLASNTAFADTIKIDLTGTVTSMSGKLITAAERTGGLGSTFINIGDTINYSFTFEETLAPGFASTNSYPDAISAFSGSVGSYNFSGISGFASITNNGRSRSGPSFDRLNFSFSPFTNTDGNADLNTGDNSIIIGDLSNLSSPLSLISIGFQSDTALISNTDFVEETITSAFSDPSIVPFLMDFSTGLVINGTFNSATISAVPLPGATWLFFSGLLGLLGITGSARSKVRRKS